MLLLILTSSPRSSGCTLPCSVAVTSVCASDIEVGERSAHQPANTRSPAEREHTNKRQHTEKCHLPVDGVQRVGLVVVSALVVAHVNRDGRVEGGEDVVRGCESTEGES